MRTIETRPPRSIRQKIGVPNTPASVVEPQCRGVIPSQGAKVTERRIVGLVPQKGVGYEISREIRLARDLTSIVESIGYAAGASKGADVDHIPLLPEERVLGWRICRARSVVRVGCEACVREPRYLTPLVGKESEGIGAAQSAQVLHPVVLVPGERDAGPGHFGRPRCLRFLCQRAGSNSGVLLHKLHS